MTAPCRPRTCTGQRSANSWSSFLPIPAPRGLLFAPARPQPHFFLTSRFSGLLESTHCLPSPLLANVILLIPAYPSRSPEAVPTACPLPYASCSAVNVILSPHRCPGLRCYACRRVCASLTASVCRVLTSPACRQPTMRSPPLRASLRRYIFGAEASRRSNDHTRFLHKVHVEPPPTRRTLPPGLLPPYIQKSGDANRY